MRRAFQPSLEPRERQGTGLRAAAASRRAPAFRLVGLACAGLTVFGCGKKGDPLPPLRKTPRPATELRLAQRGSSIEASFLAPRMTVDGERLPVMEIELLRTDQDGSFSDVAEKRVIRAAPGERLRELDSLPPPETVVRYAVRARVKKNASTLSSVVSLMTRDPPPAPEGFVEELQPEGVRLEWVQPPFAELLPTPTPTPSPSPSPTLLTPDASPGAAPSPAGPSPAAPSPEAAPAAASPSPSPVASSKETPPEAVQPTASPSPSPAALSPDALPEAAPPGASPSPSPAGPMPSTSPEAAQPAVAPSPASSSAPQPTATPTPAPTPEPFRGGVFVYRRVLIGAYAAPLTPTPLAEPSFVDTSATLGPTWCYVGRTVISLAPLIESADSKETCLQVRDIAPPAAPSGIAALLIDAEVEVSWSPSPEPDLAGYRVYRAPRGSEPQRVGEVPAGETVFREPAPERDTVILYTVTAVDGVGNESPPSSPARVQPR